MTVAYISSLYVSHRRMAIAYAEMIATKYPLTRSLKDADIVIIHDEPHRYGSFYERYPILLDKYVIACCVWEADPLPDVYQRSIRHVQELWTCSKYCKALFQQYHGNVHYVPYPIARDTSCSSYDLETVQRLIGYERGNRYILSITKLWDKRKNAGTLLRAFQNVRTANTRLIIKATSRDSALARPASGVIYIDSHLSDQHINALYLLSDLYVSAHHSEGWGLTISDAMLFSKPVVATGYSGNLEFMNTSNSYLVKNTESLIRVEDCFGEFRSHMKWAYPDEQHLAELMGSACSASSSEVTAKMVMNATRDIRKFAVSTVTAIILDRLDRIVSEELGCTGNP